MTLWASQRAYVADPTIAECISLFSIPTTNGRHTPACAAHALLIATYKNPNLDLHVRLEAAKAALPYEKPRLQAVTVANEGGEPPKMRSELEIGRRLAFVLELIARGEVKVKMPKGAPLLDGLKVPERDLAGREFAISQIASPCGSSKVDENRERKTEPGVGTGEEEQVPE